MNQLTQNSRQSLSPLRWVPSLYFAMGLPFVVLNMVSAVLFKDLGISDAQIAFWTSLIMWPWTIKFLWSPFLEIFRTKKFFVAGSGEVYRLAGCVLQPCETGRHGRPGVVRRFSLRRLQRRGCSNIRRLRTFVDGGACHSLRPARPAGRLPCPGASRRGRRCRTAFAAGWPFGPERGRRGLLPEKAYLVLPRIHHPLSSGRGLRDEDRAVVPQSRYGFGRSGPHEPADRPLLRDIRCRGFSFGFAAGGLLYRTPGPATHSFHIMLYL